MMRVSCYTLFRGTSYRQRSHVLQPASGLSADCVSPARSFVLKVPSNLSLAGAAPLLCAGITVYSPLRHFGLDKPGMKIGVVGLGGLGHMVR